MIRIALLLVVGCTAACLRADDPLPVVSRVDLNRYMGLWYEIARYPNRFQRDCFRATAEYTLLENGKVRVVNRCTRKDGSENSITGKAWVADPKTNAKLKVRFFWPFSGAYWIIDLDADYQYAVVGHPKRTYLWILSRTPDMRPEQYAAICETLKSRGYEPARLMVDREQKDAPQ